MPDVDAFRRGVAERGALYDLIPVCPRERRDLMTECPCSVVAAPFERLASSPQGRIGVNSERLKRGEYVSRQAARLAWQDGHGSRRERPAIHRPQPSPASLRLSRPRPSPALRGECLDPQDARAGGPPAASGRARLRRRPEGRYRACRIPAWASGCPRLQRRVRRRRHPAMRPRSIAMSFAFSPTG